MYVIRAPLPTTPDGTEPGTDEQADEYIKEWLSKVEEKWENVQRTAQPGVRKKTNYD